MDEIIDIDDLRKLKLPELKALCKQTGVPSSGAKDVLIKRIAISMGMDEEDEPVDEDALLEEEEEDKDEDAGVSSSDKVALNVEKGKHRGLHCSTSINGNFATSRL